MFSPDPTVDAHFDLRPGRVDPSLFPTDTWRRCMVRALRDPPPAYGDPAGTLELRTALARWVLNARGISVDPMDVVVTSGAQHAIDLVARVLVEPGATVAVEEPGLPARQRAAAHQRRRRRRRAGRRPGHRRRRHPAVGTTGLRHPVTPVPVGYVVVPASPHRAPALGQHPRRRDRRRRLRQRVPHSARPLEPLQRLGRARPGRLHRHVLEDPRALPARRLRRRTPARSRPPSTPSPGHRLVPARADAGSHGHLHRRRPPATAPAPGPARLPGTTAT
jgi:hypothetical protein